MQTDKNSWSKSIFRIAEKSLSALPWILLIASVAVFFCVKDSPDWHDLALSYVAGMVVYFLTVVIPNTIKSIKLKRYILHELALLYNEYRDLLWKISTREPETDPFALEQIQNGLEKYNCKKQSDCICLSHRTVDILRPKCSRILGATSLLISKHYAFSVEQLLVIHEITQVWFIKDIAALGTGSDYFQSRQKMLTKAEFLVQRFNALQELYFDIKHKANLTIGWHPES